MTPPKVQTAAQVAARKRRAKDAEQTRKRGYVDVTFPPALEADARFLKCQWDSTTKCWVGKVGVQAQLDAIAVAAPDGATEIHVVEDCPYCEQPDAYHTRVYRHVGSAEWSDYEVARCDYCYATTSHPLFVAEPREPGETFEQWRARMWAAIKARQKEQANGIAPAEQ